MRFTILEMFLIFWLSAFLWVMVEYFYQRLTKKNMTKQDLEQYKKDHNEDSFAA